MRFEIAGMDRAEVLRYLGYAGQDMTDELSGRIDAGIARCLEVCQPAGVWADFPVEGTRTRADGAPELAGMTSASICPARSPWASWP